MKINIGCGKRSIPGFIGVDVTPGPAVGIVSDVRVLPFETGTVDEAMAIHVIEHFYAWEVQAVLKEWVRVLKPGAKLALECPNLDKAVEHYMKARADRKPVSDQMVMWPLYGDPGWRDPLMCHRWGYNPDTLGALMVICGLVDIRQEPAQYHMKELRDLRMVGFKPIL